jgi:ubiquinol-cytochrome c reductase cytochrome c1 subunit
VTYADGTPATRDQMARDVSAFLTWAAEPNLQSRRMAGWAVLVFLIFVTILSYLAYQNIWATAKRAVRITGPLDPENIARREAADREAGVHT